MTRKVTKTIQCKLCGKTIPETVTTKTKGHFCGECRARLKKYALKAKAVAYKGGKCEKCGYNKNIAALEFHHKDPSIKDFGISYALDVKLPWEVLRAELDKCSLLCSNCHREEHTPQYDSTALNEIFNSYQFIKEETAQNPYQLVLQQRHLQKEKAKNNRKEKKNQRIQLIKESNIDFSKYGWAQKLAALLGIRSSVSAMNWVRRNMPDFYETQCFKEQLMDDNLIQQIIHCFNECHNIKTVSEKLGVYYNRVRAVLKENHVKIRKGNSKEVCMLDKHTGEIIKNFSSLTEAALYCKQQKNGIRSNNTSISSITQSISECLNGHKKTSYGYVWEFTQ